jgi:hypothetical protein
MKHEEAGGPDTLDNCIPVCFDCHADMRSYDFKHPKGSKYSERELRGHRDRWFALVAAGGRAEIDARIIARDRRVYSAFTEQIKYDPTIVYFKHHGFEASFDLDILEPFHRYEYYCDDPNNQFVDVELEKLRGGFLNAANRLCSLLALNTWPLKHSTRHLNQIPQEWRETNSARLDKLLADLDEAHGTLVTAYEGLVHECQIRLEV